MQMTETRYEPAFKALIQTRDMIRVWPEVAGRFERPCLLCAVETPEHCHWRLVAEAVAGGDLARVQHLVG